jgi:signal transduction histidine kinase
MGKSSSAGSPEPGAARRTIRFTFTATVAVPATCLILLWALAAGAVLGSSLKGHGFWSPDHREVVELTFLVGAGLVIGLVCIILMGRFSSKLSREIAGLAATTRRSADEQLPQLLERLRTGDTGIPAVTAGAPPSGPRPKNAEIAQALAAVASLEQTAVGAAAGEAGLRDGLRQVFVSLARRNQSLLQRQLRLIDALEHKASDSAALADLFALDHLTTRMRRHAESLAILSGAAPGRSWTEPVPIIDVIRAAMAEVEDYRRVTVLTTSEDAVAAPAVADMIHLLAELIENATMFSPSGTRVEVRAERVANGFAVEIDDRGLGIEPAQLAQLNQQLAQPPDFDLANADRLGLFVGAKLAARHGVRVSLRQSPYGGTTAIVLMPTTIIVLVSPAAVSPGPLPAARRVTGRPAGLDLGSGAALALSGRRAASPPAVTAQPATTAQLGTTAQPATTGQLGTTGQPGRTEPAEHVTPAASAVPASGPGPSSGPAATDTAPPASVPTAGAFPTASTGPASTGPASTGPASTGPAAEPAPPGSNGAAAPRRGLPHRTRQASLSPHLRDSLAVGRPARSEPADDSRTPEQARDLAASLQTGWRRGRQDDEPEPPDTAGPPRPRQSAPAAPDNEEG